MRRRALSCLILALGLASVPPGLRAEPAIAVIVARDAAAPRLRLDRVTLRDVYLKKIFVDAGGTALIPVNLPADHPLRRAFSLSVLRATSDGLQAYWNERYFHGVRPPYVLASENAVVRFVATTAGAVGYIATCRMDRSVRQVLRLPVPPPEREAIARLCEDKP